MGDNGAGRDGPRTRIVIGRGRVNATGGLHVPDVTPIAARKMPTPPEDKRPPVGTLIAVFPASCRGARHVFGGNVVLTLMVEEANKYDALPITDYRDAVYEIEVRIGNARVRNMPRTSRNVQHESERVAAGEGNNA